MAKSPAYRRMGKEISYFLFVLALLCQLAIPFTQALAALSAGAVDSSGRTIVLCTSSGLIAQSINDHKPGETAPYSAPCEFCQVCQLAVSGASHPLLFKPFSFITLEAAAPPAFEFKSAGKPAAYHIHRPVRAPPVSV